MYKNTIRFLKEYLPDKGKGYFVGIFTLIVTIITTTVIPVYIKDATNILSAKEFESNALLKTSLIILALGTTLSISRVLSRVYIFLEGRKIEAEVRQDLFRAVVNMPMELINKYQSGDLISRGTNDVTSVRVMISMGVLHTINSLLTVSFCLFYMFRISIELTLFCLIPLPLIIIITKLLSNKMMVAGRETQQQLGVLSETVREQFRAHNLLSIFPIFKLLNPQFEADNEKYSQKAEHLMSIRVFIMVAVMSILSLGMYILLRFGGPAAINSDLLNTGGFDIGAFIAFSLYLGIIQGPLRAAGFLFPLLQRGEICLQRIYEVRDEAANAQEQDQARPIQQEEQFLEPQTKSLVQLHNVNFSYNTENSEAFKLSIDELTINKGVKYGIFGATGSGKTTLFNLLVGNLRTAGLKYKKTSYEEISSAMISQQFSIVPQENRHFSKTIQENIDQVLNQESPADKKRTDFANAYEISQLEGDIEEFKEGLDTLLGEQGINLSGGQKQRLSILRALVKPREILLMDDFISAVDHKTEMRIVDSLFKQLKDETFIFISHRISALIQCDEILIMDQGQIIAKGSHEELLKVNSNYRETFEHQMLEFQRKNLT
jgi:ATP-binding cassette, subfamily B, multidrug efflux pump